MVKRLLVPALLCASASAAESKSWTVKPDFQSDAAAVQISGASCPNQSKRQDWCIAINDEKKYFQFFQRDDRWIRPGERVRILDKKDAAGRKMAEPDIEAVARDGGFVYLTGSHGAPRKGGAPEPSRFLIFRLPVDARTGKPAFKITRKRVAKGIDATTRLGPALAALPALTGFAGKPLAQNGVTIEGLGARNGQLFFGLRTPVIDGQAAIVQASANALFSNGKLNPKLHRVALGEGYGIRGIERFRQGFLLLAGTGYGDEMPPTIWYWEPGSAAQRIAMLDAPSGWKAEGLMTVSAKPDKRPRIVLFFDGQKNGAPLEFKLPRIAVGNE